MELPQPSLHELLPLESGLVLGVLPQVAQLDGLGDGLGEKDIELMAELVDFADSAFPASHGSWLCQTDKRKPAWSGILPGSRK